MLDIKKISSTSLSTHLSHVAEHLLSVVRLGPGQLSRLAQVCQRLHSTRHQLQPAGQRVGVGLERPRARLGGHASGQRAELRYSGFLLEACLRTKKMLNMLSNGKKIKYNNNLFKFKIFILRHSSLQWQ